MQVHDAVPNSPELSVLEALYAARDTLSDLEKPYCFHTWKCCTCGHIYTAATHKKGVGDTAVVEANDDVYIQALKAVWAAATEQERNDTPVVSWSEITWPLRISALTLVRCQAMFADHRRQQMRYVARSLVDDAIAMLEAEQTHRTREVACVESELVTA